MLSGVTQFVTAWRAKQDDLTSKRKEFHGAVTYAFGGVFSWSMYGSTEAVDEVKIFDNIYAHFKFSIFKPLLTFYVSFL